MQLQNHSLHRVRHSNAHRTSRVIKHAHTEHHLCIILIRISTAKNILPNHFYSQIFVGWMLFLQLILHFCGWSGEQKPVAQLFNIFCNHYYWNFHLWEIWGLYYHSALLCAIGLVEYKYYSTLFWWDWNISFSSVAGLSFSSESNKFWCLFILSCACWTTISLQIFPVPSWTTNCSVDTTLESVPWDIVLCTGAGFSWAWLHSYLWFQAVRPSLLFGSELEGWAAISNTGTERRFQFGSLGYLWDMRFMLYA